MKNLIFIVLLFLPFIGIAQKKPTKQSNDYPCTSSDIFECLIEKGDYYFRVGNYEMAINKYAAAQTYNREKSAEATKKITSAFLKVDNLRKRAVQAQQNEKKATAKAENEKEKAIAARNEAIVSLKAVEEALKKAQSEQKINEWSVYAATQAPNNANHAWYLAENGCQQSHYTNLMAILQRTQLWTDYDKPYYAQSFFHPLSSPVTAMAVSPNDSFMVAGFQHGSAIVWTIKTGQQYDAYPKSHQKIQAVAVSNRGTVAILTKSENRTNPTDTLFIYASDNKSHEVFMTSKTAINCISLSTDGRYLAVGMSNGDTHTLLLDFENIEKRLATETDFSLTDYMTSLKVPVNEVVSAHFSSDNQYVVTACGDRTAKVFDLKGNIVFNLIGHAAMVRSVAYSNDGLFIASASDDKTIKLWDAQNGQNVATFTAHTEGVKYVAFIPNSDFLVSFADNEVFIWNRNGQIAHQLKGHNQSITTIAASVSGNNVFTGDASGVIRQWVIDANQRVLVQKPHDGTVEAMAFSKDCNLIATGAADKKVKLWQLNGKLLRTFEGHFGQIESLDFSKDDKYLLSSANDNIIRLWRTEGPPAGLLVGHQGSVHQALFMPHGQHVLSGSSDSTVRIWTFDGREQAKLVDKRKPTSISTVACSRDGLTVYAGGENGIVTIWQKKGDNWGITDTFRYAYPLLSPLKIKISKDNQYLVLVGGKGVDIRNLKTRAKQNIETTFVALNADFDPLSNLLSVAGNLSQNYIYDVKSQTQIHTFNHIGLTNTLFSPDGQSVLTCGSMGNITLHNILGETEMIYGNNETPIQYVFCSEKEDTYATIDSFGVSFWDSTGVFLNKCLSRDAIISASYAKAINELWLLQANNILIRVDAHRRKVIDIRPLSIAVTSATISPDGSKVFANMKDFQKDKFLVVDTVQQKEFYETDIKYMAWVKNDFLFSISKVKNVISLVALNDTANRKSFTVPTIRPICAAISPDAQTFVVGDEQDGFLYLFKTSEDTFIDSIKTEAGITKIEFIDNQHFLTFNIKGKTQLHAVVQEDNSQRRITPVLQTFDNSTGVWAYNNQNHKLMVVDKNSFNIYPLAIMGDKPTDMDSIWWHEKLAYNLPFKEFEIIKKYKSDTLLYQKELTSLAMMKHIKSSNDRYFKKSVNLISALRYAQAAKDQILERALSSELDTLEAQINQHHYDDKSLFTGSLEDFNQLKNDALELDGIYNLQDPNPLYVAKAADRFSNAAYMAVVTGNPDEAIRLAQKALILSPTKTWAVKNLALGYLYAGQREKAFELYDKFKNKLWKNSGYPLVESTETGTFKDKFLEDIDDIKDYYLKQDSIAFSHLAKIDFDEVKRFLKSEKPKITNDSEPIVTSKGVNKTSESDISAFKTSIVKEKRTLTRDEKYLLKQIANQDNHAKYFSICNNFINNIENDFLLDSTNMELRSALAQTCFYKAWHGLFLKKFSESEFSVTRALALDTTQNSCYLVLAHAQLFQDKLNEARNNYLIYLNRVKNPVQEIRSDWQLFKEEGITSTYFDDINKLIQEHQSGQTKN